MQDSLTRWPNVPACYGWLSLDARGRWRLQDETISHPGMIAFLNANYTCEADGSWLVKQWSATGVCKAGICALDPAPATRA